ncbi:hypothetical protein MTO96_026145 [Rhipicephalus appendiculatus]
MYHSAQQMRAQMSRREELSSRKRSMTLNLDKPGRSQHISEQACSSSLLTSPGQDMPELEVLIMGLYASSGDDADTNYAPPQPVLRKHVTSGPNASDSSDSTSSPSFIVPSSSEHSVLDDYVKDKTRTVPALGTAPPLCSIESYEDSSGGDGAPQTMVHQAPQPEPRCEQLSSRKRTVTVHLDNAGRCQHISEQADPSSLLTSPDLNMLQLTSTEREELNMGFYVPETPPKPTTLFSLTEETEQYATVYAYGPPELQLLQQEQEQTQEQSQTVLQQQVISGRNTSDSDDPISNPGFSPPSLSEHSAMSDYVKDKTQTVPALGATSPRWYISSDEDSSGGDGAEQTTMLQAPQQLSRSAEFSSRKRTMALALDNASSHQHNRKQARVVHAVPRPGARPPRSPIDMRHGERTKLAEKSVAHEHFPILLQAPRRLATYKPWLQEHATSNPNAHDSGTWNVSLTLPSSSKYSAMVDDVKLKTQMAAALGSTSPLWSVGSDEDSSGRDCEHQMMMHQPQQQQLSRCEELCSLTGTVTLDTDSEHQWNSKQARNPQSQPRPTAGLPLSPIDMRDRERAKLREKEVKKPNSESEVEAATFGRYLAAPKESGCSRERENHA